MCTWAICWLMTKKGDRIDDKWLGWALFVDLFIFSSIGSGDLIHLEFGK